MSDPVLVMTYGQTYIYYTCDRDPTNNEPLVYQGYGDMLIFWWNQTANTVWQCLNNTVPMVWNKIVDNANILNVLSAAGWKINTNRNYVQRSSPAFNTSYTPSTTNDTDVIAVVTLTSTLVTTAEVEIQVNSGAGFGIIAIESLSGLAATTIRSFPFAVPTNGSYKLISVSGTTSISQVMELSR